METFNYLTLVRRDDLIELFKTGIIYPQSAIEYSGSLPEFARQIDKVKKIFDKTPNIDFSINYFILKASYDQKTAVSTKGLSVANLKNIIPLDRDSAKVGLDLMPPVVITDPYFEDAYHSYQIDCAVENSRKGVLNIEAIFGVSKLWDTLPNNGRGKKKKVGLTEKDLPPIIQCIFDVSGKTLPETAWGYLLTYVRSALYPGGIQGAFLDTMSVVANFTKKVIVKRDMRTSETAKLIMNRSDLRFMDLLDIIDPFNPFAKSAENVYPNFWQIATQYFVLFDFFSKVSEDGSEVKGKPVVDFVNQVNEHYEADYLYPALLLLGITLGQSGTYKILYSVRKDDYTFLSSACTQSKESQADEEDCEVDEFGADVSLFEGEDSVAEGYDDGAAAQH